MKSCGYTIFFYISNYIAEGNISKHEKNNTYLLMWVYQRDF